jgi:hypothetical protein
MTAVAGRNVNPELILLAAQMRITMAPSVWQICSSCSENLEGYANDDAEMPFGGDSLLPELQFGFQPNSAG